MMRASQSIQLLLIAVGLVFPMEHKDFDVYSHIATYQQEKKRYGFYDDPETGDVPYNLGIEAVREFLQTENHKDLQHGIKTFEQIASHHIGARYCLCYLCKNGFVDLSLNPELLTYFSEFNKDSLSEKSVYEQFHRSRAVFSQIIPQMEEYKKRKKME